MAEIHKKCHKMVIHHVLTCKWITKPVFFAAYYFLKFRRKNYDLRYFILPTFSYLKFAKNFKMIKIELLILRKNFCILLEKLNYWKGHFKDNFQNWIFIQKSNFQSKIEISIKNRFFSQKSNFQSKIDFSVKNRIFSQKANSQDYF